MRGHGNVKVYSDIKAKIEVKHVEQEKMNWTAQAGFARQMRALAPIAKGVLAACALALIVLTPFGLMENTMGGKLFPLWFSALLLALSWGVLAVGGAIACLRRGKVELEYSLDAHTIRLTERGRQVKSEELPLKDVNQLKRIGDGMKLKCGRKQVRIFCDKVTCERIESMVYAERA